MQLELDKLQAFATGCYGSDIAEGAWRAHRLPPPMRPHYDTEERFQVRMACTSGVRLRFVSDTRRLKLALRYGVEARSIYQGALIVDGKLAAAVGPQNRCETWNGIVFEQADQRKRLFDFWFPHLCRADVVSVELDDKAVVNQAPTLPVRWLAYGDSITQGMISTLPTLSMVGRCALALNAEVHNVALGSATAEPWMADTVPGGRYDLISIAYGTNEFNKDVPVGTYQDNVRRLVASLRRKHPTCPIVLLTPLTWVRSIEAKKTGTSLGDYRQSLFPLAKEFAGIHLVRGETLVPDDDKWFVDGVHPNDIGFEVYAANLLPRLQAALS